MALHSLRSIGFFAGTAAALLGAAAPGAAEAADPASLRPPNFVLITLDTTRADHLGAYGWRWARTPNLDRLAAGGVLFTRCDSSAPITLPSHASLLTGLQPPRHGVRDNGTFRLGEEAVTLGEVLRERGYDTAAAVAAVVLGSRYGLAQGFRLYDEELSPASAGRPAEERDAAAVTEAALALLGQLEEPFFLWVHYFDPHADYRAPETVRAAQRGPTPDYDAEIAHLDEQLGRLLAALPAATVRAVVGDHGEMLGDHGEATHGVLLHHGARRVPLLLAGPGVPAGTTVEELVRTVDVAPTLLALVEAPPLPGADGESLLPLFQQLDGGSSPGPSSSGISYAESFLPYYSFRWHPLRALSDGRWLYVDGPRPRLFDLEADLAETEDLAAAQPERTRRWGARLGALLRSWGEEGDHVPEPGPLSAEERRALAALGYLGGGGGSGDDPSELPDPYALVDVPERLHALGGMLAAGRCEEALPALRTILRRNRDNLPALNMAGLCLMGSGEHAAALPYFEHAVRAHPASTIARANFAGCLLRLGRRAEAEAAYRETLARDPAEATSVANLAELLRERGAPAEALAVVERALATGSTRVQWIEERGLAQAALGRLAGALEDFQAVLEAEPENEAALENAALAAYRLGRAADAVALYRRLAARDPGRSAAWKTLGALQLHELGDAEGARESFLRALAVEQDPAERAELEAILGELGGG